MSRLTNENNSLVTYFNSKSQISEGYRKLRTNIQFSSIDSHIKKSWWLRLNPAKAKQRPLATWR